MIAHLKKAVENGIATNFTLEAYKHDVIKLGDHNTIHKWKPIEDNVMMPEVILDDFYSIDYPISISAWWPVSGSWIAEPTDETKDALNKIYELVDKINDRMKDIRDKPIFQKGLIVNLWVDIAVDDTLRKYDDVGNEWRASILQFGIIAKFSRMPPYDVAEDVAKAITNETLAQLFYITYIPQEVRRWIDDISSYGGDTYLPLL